MGPLPSMKNLLWYLEKSFDEYASFNMDICHGLPWNKDTIMFVLSYIFEFISKLEEHYEFSDAITPLHEIASFLRVAITRIEETEDSPKSTREIQTKQDELSEILQSSSFLEVVRRFFRVPKLHQLPQSDKHLYPNEIIAGFMDFLLQVLYHQTNISEDQVQRWAIVRKELSFLLAILGDIPFQCTHHDHEIVEEINILLAEFEILANEAGTFVYDVVFPTDQMEANKFHATTISWLEKAELFNAKIKEHCFKFSELHMSLISRSIVVDSFFIVHSLIEDIENLKNHSLSFNHCDAIMEQMKTLHGELTLSQSFIKVLRDNEEKEGLLQIRDLAYEAEYLINSLVVGNIDVWYLNLRLPSINHEIKLARIELQEKTKDIKASDGNSSFPTSGDTATMDENHFLDFNDDITQRILTYQSDYMKILEISYKQLPRHLKPCFLYFATFPEDSEVSQEMLKWLWISEGFILKEGNESREETAEMYLLDLINRKLVLIEKRGSNGGIKKCRIQSVLHEFCVKKANEENFSKFTNGFSMYEKCQRFCIASTESSNNYWKPFGLHCRSYRDLRTREVQNSSCFRTMALLKVMDESLSPCPSSLAFPAQLRYLDVRGFSSKMVANLVNLEYIYVTEQYSLYVPSVVLRMVKLRHFVVKKGRAKFEEDCSSNMTETTNLRTLSGVWINGKKDEEILRCCPQLRKLNCIFQDYCTKFPDLSFLTELESLKLSFTEHFPPKILSPNYYLPSTIKKLCLVTTKLPWKMMSIVGRLPNLEVLKLDEKSFSGEVWLTRDGEFQKLKCLKIYNFWYDLRLWISCSQHFPVLECLVLRHCIHLVEIPSDFANIRTLQRIEVRRCTDEAYLSTLQFRKQHIKVEMSDLEKTNDQLILQLTDPWSNNLENLLSCMEEYFEAGGTERFINKLPIIGDQTDDEATTEAETTDAFGSDQKEDETTEATKLDEDDDDEPWIFCNHQTYFIVVIYAMQFSSNLEDLAIMVLRCIAESYNNRKQFLPRHTCYADEIKKTIIKFSDRLVSSFIPQVLRFFEVPKMEQLPDKDKHLKKNEILTSVMDFLLQILSCEVNTDSAVAEKYALLQRELSFLLAVLGDIPFQPTDHPGFDNQLDNLLAEFEMFANEAGGFLFSCVFPMQPMKVSRFHVEINDLLEMARLLNAKIKEHCAHFSELPASAIVRSRFADSFFIVDSLIEDIQSTIMNGQLVSSTTGGAVMEQMKTLHGELTMFQSFIRIMQNNDSNEKKEGLFQITDLIYEAEYLINSVVNGNIHVWYLNIRLPTVICKIKLAFIGLQQISEAKVIKASGNISFPTTGSTASLHDNQFLDLNHDVTQRILMDLTRRSSTSRLVVSIFGMPGLGKTTTANELYNCCSSHFDRRAWCIVSQNYNVRNLLIEILMCVTSEPNVNNFLKKDVAELGVDIHKTLKGRRYLIVLDDVWCSDVLDKLTIYFPDDGNGSRVLITTRNKDVSPDGSIPHELPILSENQCWNLLEKKVFSNDLCPSHLVSIGKRIAAKCSGIPLAVVSIAGVLVNVEKEESEWKRVEERLEMVLLDYTSDYRKIVELSYEHLPHTLKPCFLYFAIFPEDAEISTKELKLFWIAQGFVQKDGNKSPEEIAEMYLLDLINRSLVMTAKRRSIGGTKTCRIHDLLHDICIKKADEQNFIKSTNLLSTYNKHQHLSLHTSSNINWRPFGHHCRSIRDCHAEQSSGFRTMALLRAVDLLPKNKFSGIDSTGVDLPCQLRYLGISCEVIPEGMLDNLLKLEVLHVRGGRRSEIVVPSVILRKLRHLFVREEAKFEEDCSDKISEATNLRSISGILFEKKSDEEILRKSPHLRTLKCKIGRGGILFPDLSSLAELESLRIDYHVFFFAEALLSESSFPLTLKKLCLNRSRLPWEKMSIIGDLPNLQVLKVEWDAFKGDEWETRDDQFQELRFLKIESWNLKQWSCESCHFPSLEQLVLSKCNRLVEIPSDLGYIPSLQRIEVDDCSYEACVSGIEIEKEQHEFGNEELQVDIIDSYWKKEELMRELETESAGEDTDTESGGEETDAE